MYGLYVFEDHMLMSGPHDVFVEDATFTDSEFNFLFSFGLLNDFFFNI